MSLTYIPTKGKKKKPRISRGKERNFLGIDKGKGHYLTYYLTPMIKEFIT